MTPDTPRDDRILTWLIAWLSYSIVMVILIAPFNEWLGWWRHGSVAMVLGYFLAMMNGLKNGR